MSLLDLLNKKIVVTQVKSESNLTDRQFGTLVGLGLRGINTSSSLLCSSSTLGMIKKVNHLIKIKLS
jgi:ribosomal protein L30